MKITKSFAAAMLLSFFMLSTSTYATAQNYTVKSSSTDKKEKVEERYDEKPGTSIQNELKKIVGNKTETSLTGARIENIGNVFLDKYTGEITIVDYYKGDPVRWNIKREKASDDIVSVPDKVTYQLIKIGTSYTDLLLVNIDTGATWSLYVKGLTMNYKNARFQYLPKMDADW